MKKNFENFLDNKKSMKTKVAYDLFELIELKSN